MCLSGLWISLETSGTDYSVTRRRIFITSPWKPEDPHSSALLVFGLELKFHRRKFRVLWCRWVVPRTGHLEKCAFLLVHFIAKSEIIVAR